MLGVRIAAVVIVLAGVAAACTSTPMVGLADRSGVVGVAAPDMRGPIRVVGRDLVDATGRVVQIHGVNSVAKWEPWVTPTVAGEVDGHDTLTPDDLAALDRDGFDGVRLGVRPAALMPAPGVVDTAYLDRVERTVDTLSEHGIWVLLDLHQDVFTGMPAWATTPSAAALSPDPPAWSSVIGWAAGYLSPRSLQQWSDWWANAEVAPSLGVVDAYAAGAAALADRFDEDPAVIGLELMNEPFPGPSVLDCLFAGCPGLDGDVARTNDRIGNAVRAAAPRLPVWVEQQALFPTYADAAAPTPTITPSTDGGAATVASFHTYCWDTDGGRPEQPDPALATLCDAVFTTAFGRALAMADRWGAPAVLTEFGASQSPLNATTPTRLADEHLVSWFHWHHGSYPAVVESQLVRTYAQATAGRPLSQSFDPATGNFTFRYAPDRSITAPTSIVVPGRAYPDGYRVDVTGGHVTSAPQSGRLTVEPDASSAVVEVTVGRV